jgi:hypothetical protein
VLRWSCALVTGAVLTGFCLLLVTGRYVYDGPTVVSVSSSHGLHEGDVFVLSGWFVAMVTLGLLTWSAGRR